MDPPTSFASKRTLTASISSSFSASTLDPEDLARGMKKGRPAEKGAAEGKGTEPDGPVYPTVDYPQFEFDKYVSKYRGYGRVTRLLWIAHCCPQFQVRAYQQAISELKR